MRNIDLSEKRFSVSTIIHQGFLGFLRDHLSSLNAAQNRYNRRIQFLIFLSNFSDNNSLHKVRNILAEFPNLNVNFYADPKIYTCGAARNFILNRTKTKWTVFFDADVKVSDNYFTNFSKVLDSTLHEGTRAFAGGIGSSKSSRFGYYEALMDIYSYYGKTNKINLQTEMMQEYLWEIGHTYPTSLTKIESQLISYLQGFNQIIHIDMMNKHGGFDENFFGAEDREMAAKVKSKGYGIVLIPQCSVFHYYNFTLRDIVRRKYGHGYYSAMFRRKYAQEYPNDYLSGVRKWSRSFRSLLLPPTTFRSFTGLLYYHISFWPYFLGSCAYNLESLFKGIKFFNFIYSNYSFADSEKE